MTRVPAELTARPAQAGSAGPPAGSRAEARALASKLLSRLVLPPGSRPDRARVLAPGVRTALETLAGGDSVDLHRVFRVPLRAAALQRFLLAHAPTGMKVTGQGQGGNGSGETVQTVNYVPRSWPAGIYTAALVTAVLPGTAGGSLLRADAQVIWYPRRSAAETLSAAQFRVARVSASILNPKPHTVTRSITSQRVIRRLTALLNGLHAAPPMVLPCPLEDVSYRVEFAASARSAHGTVATATGCLTDTVRTGRAGQPSLWDPGNALATALSRLLGLKAAALRGAAAMTSS